jgi:hypothetical protein
LAGLAERAVGTTPTGLNATPSSSPLRGRARVEPRPFSSTAPMVGPAVARLRAAWNWMSTRWYLAPILEQQNAFNAEVVETLERIEHRLAALERRVDLQAGWLAEIDRDLVALARRVGAAERND